MLLSCLVFVLVCNALLHAEKIELSPSGRDTLSFNSDWCFSKGDPANADSIGFDDSSWRKLDLPHDWAIEGPFSMELLGKTGKLPYIGVGWYRKHFTLSDSQKGRRICVCFDGVMSNAKVWINDKCVGQWPYGYSSFWFDLTDYINFGGENVIAVRIENLDLSSRWYPGAGIYRNVWLTSADPVHVAQWGTFVRASDVSEERATVKVTSEVENQLDKDVDVVISQDIFPEGKPNQVLASMSLEGMNISAGSVRQSDFTFILSGMKLWDVDSPNMYTLRTTVKSAGRTVDTYDTPFGIRSAKFDPDKGFILNGRRVPLNGVCMHHDLGPLGSAVHKRAIERQLEILAEMGCNAIRTSHNMPAPELLELCDRKGFLVLNEAFDCWERGKNQNDYHLYFKQWHEKDLVNFIHRDRNHPCVILWSSGNEIPEQGDPGHGHDISRELTGIFHREDPTRPVTSGCNHPGAASNGFQNTIDVYGFNYKPRMYTKFHQDNPNKPYYSSESSSCVSSRGEYYFPVSDKQNEGFFNYQVSSYDLYAPGWAMKPDLEFIGLDENYPSAAGEFVWTGFDYIGEPTPYQSDYTILLNYHTEAEKQEALKNMEELGGRSPSRSSYFGIVDLCGFKKDRFYIYQARWRPELPMAHILPHWNWPERVGQVTPVHVYTSGDSAELFLNGKSLGKRVKVPVLADKKPEKTQSLSTGKKVTASSHEDSKGNQQWKGNDGDLETRWCAADGNENQWWQVDLEKVQPIKSCVIYWEKDSGQYKFEIKTSEDAQNWDVVASSDFKGKRSVSKFSFDTQARYLRVEFSGLKSSSWASFYECHVYNESDPKIDTVNDSSEHYRLRWDDVVYEPGELKVVAYKDGRQWATDVMKTTGPAYQVKLTRDRETIDADGSDLSYVTAEIVDADGRMVPRTDNLISFQIQGPGQIVATGNGDATSHVSFQAADKKAYNGMCLAIVKSQKEKSGTITLTATSQGLKSDTVKIKSRR